MATLTADPDLITVDLNKGDTTGTTQIFYNKRSTDVVWERIGPSTTAKWDKERVEDLVSDLDQKEEQNAHRS